MITNRENGGQDMGKKKQGPNARQLLKDALADVLKVKLQQTWSELKVVDEKRKEREEARL
ncbi:DUF3886 domain-containing protein, partial [Bacillus sp. GbtcB13]|uniref:DUF3886 domain-containing protein n=1 Tax=Bacillus sp. GbtcB13 TaxID=2824758 RepID=UPI0028157B06